MKFELRPLMTKHKTLFMKDMQNAFQQAVPDGLCQPDEFVLPQSHIEKSLQTQGANAYSAFYKEKFCGGAIVLIDEQTQHNQLEFLYVKTENQNMGIGLSIWKTLEIMYPKTKVWETSTPYFDKRNIHFYVNRCGFQIVEFFNKMHPDFNDCTGDNLTAKQNNAYFDGMFRFAKNMYHR